MQVRTRPPSIRASRGVVRREWSAATTRGGRFNGRKRFAGVELISRGSRKLRVTKTSSKTIHQAEAGRRNTCAQNVFANTAVVVAGAGSMGGILAMCVGRFRNLLALAQKGLAQKRYRPESTRSENKRRNKVITSKEKGNKQANSQHAMKTPPVVSQQEWEAAHQHLLTKEKAFTRRVTRWRRNAGACPGSPSISATSLKDPRVA